jgi:hypothetical protein
LIQIKARSNENARLGHVLPLKTKGYDADGNGAGAAVQIATVGIGTHPALTQADFVVI